MARRFDGVGQYLRGSYVPVTGPPFTTFIRFNANSIHNGIMMELGPSVAGSGWFRWTVTSGNKVQYLVNNASLTATLQNGSGTYGVGQWNSMMTVEASTSSRSMYWNGIRQATNTNVRPVTVVNTHSIATSPLTSVFFSGMVAEVAFWNVTLGTEEAGFLHWGGSPRLVRAGSLVRYWVLSGLDIPEIDYYGRSPLAVFGYGGVGNDAPLVDMWRQSERVRRSQSLFGKSAPAVAGTFNAAWLSCNKLLGGGIC